MIINVHLESTIINKLDGKVNFFSFSLLLDYHHHQQGQTINPINIIFVITINNLDLIKTKREQINWQQFTDYFFRDTFFSQQNLKTFEYKCKLMFKMINSVNCYSYLHDYHDYYHHLKPQGDDVNCYHQDAFKWLCWLLPI